MPILGDVGGLRREDAPPVSDVPKDWHSRFGQLLYIGEYTTQFFRELITGHYQDPNELWTNQYNGMSEGFLNIAHMSLIQGFPLLAGLEVKGFQLEFENTNQKKVFLFSNVPVVSCCCFFFRLFVSCFFQAVWISPNNMRSWMQGPGKWPCSSFHFRRVNGGFHGGDIDSVLATLALCSQDCKTPPNTMLFTKTKFHYNILKWCRKV